MSEPTDAPTLAQIGEQAKAEAQRLLDAAKDGLQRAEEALGEAAGTPLFGNGLAASMRAARENATSLGEQIVKLKAQVENYDRKEVPDASKNRGAAMRGET